MNAILFLALSSFGLCTVLTPLCRDLFRRLNVVDQPDQERKIHQRPIPRAGGGPILLSYFGSVGLALLVLPQRTRLAIHHANIFTWLVPAVCLVFLVGLVDDIYGLRPRTKLAFQALAAGLVCFGGIRISALNDWGIPAWFGIPLTLVWLIVCTNAINLIDGLDGLAAGVSLFATLTAMAVAAIQGNIGLVLAAVPLAGSLLAFLRYNFNPASVFLGDSGSLTVGFMLGCFAVIWCQKSATFVGLLAPLVSLSLPLLDLTLAAIRRFLANRSIFSADRGHIHHRLLEQGMVPRDAALALYGVCIVAAFLAISLCLVGQVLGSFILLGTAVAIVTVAVWKLRFVEFEVARDLLLDRKFRRSVADEISLRTFKRNLSAATSLEECWNLIIDVGRELNFQSVGLTSRSHALQCSLSTVPESELWSIRIAFEPGFALILRRHYAEKETPTSLDFLRIVRTTLQSKRFLDITPEESQVPIESELKFRTVGSAS